MDLNNTFGHPDQIQANSLLSLAESHFIMSKVQLNYQATSRDSALENWYHLR